jgi:hypothetical protein
MPLNDDDVNAVLLRADQIQRAGTRGASEVDYQRFIEKAEASGYSKTAVQQALRERFGFSAAPVAVGDRVFALSSEGRYHPARVLSQSPNGIRVQFMMGSEADIAIDQVRPLSLVPGERVYVQWPAWGKWLCTVMAYDEPTQTVKLSDRWGSEQLFKVAEIWLEPPGERPSGVGYITMMTLSATIGVAVGALATLFFLR